MQVNKIKRIINDPLSFTEKEKDEVLKAFMKEFFHFPTLCKVGFFTPEMRGDYKAQAERVTKFFGFSSIYEYGLGARHETSDGGFSWKMKSIYE